MIKIIIELDFFGLGIHKKKLKEFKISNNLKCKNHPIEGNYDVILDNKRYINVVQNFERKKGNM